MTYQCIDAENGLGNACTINSVGQSVGLMLNCFVAISVQNKHNSAGSQRFKPAMVHMRGSLLIVEVISCTMCHIVVATDPWDGGAGQCAMMLPCIVKLRQ